MSSKSSADEGSVAPAPPSLTGTGAGASASNTADADADRAIVAEVLAGNVRAFQTLVERHQARVFHLAKALLRNRADAADIAQEAFVRSYANLKSYRAEGSFTAWIARITNNLAIDFLRRQKTRAADEFDETAADRGGVQSQAGLLAGQIAGDPQAEFVRRELGERLETAMAQLPEKHRAILILREVDGLSYEELAQALEIPAGTVMSRLFHARSKMQALLTEYVSESNPASLDHKRK